MLQKLGREKPWPVTTDQGRFEVTKTASDRMVFEVPSLRNVAKTAPYFHDGSVATLEDAIVLMGRYQLDLEFNQAEVARIKAWLGALTGEIPAEYIARPKLPD